MAFKLDQGSPTFMTPEPQPPLSLGEACGGFRFLRGEVRSTFAHQRTNHRQRAPCFVLPRARLDARTPVPRIRSGRH